MICVHCNTPVPDHSKFCLSCGSLVSDPDVQSAATAALDASATIQMESLLREDTEGEFEAAWQPSISPPRSISPERSP